MNQIQSQAITLQHVRDYHKTKNPETFIIGVLGNKVSYLHFTFQNPHYHTQSLMLLVCH
jgi:hypothetical protein